MRILETEVNGAKLRTNTDAESAITSGLLSAKFKDGNVGALNVIENGRIYILEASLYKRKQDTL